MIFDRYRVQLRCEKLVGAADLQAWMRERNTFESLELGTKECSVLEADLQEDAKDIYFKGLLSLCEAICSINRNLYSWATVKLYYSVFYFLRSSLAAKGYAIVRNKSLYLLRVHRGERPKKKDAKRYRSDHTGMINIYRDLFEESDILESNTIQDLNPYHWLMERRNQVNYSERKFHEPEWPHFLGAAAKQAEKRTLDSLVALYVDDPDYLYCFQSDHACLALPLKRALLTNGDFQDESLSTGLDDGKKTLLEKLMPLRSKPFQETFQRLL